MTFTYDVGDDEYPDYAKKTTFSMPLKGANSTVIARRTHQGGDKSLKGWLMDYVGDDPGSDWTLYRPSYCIEYPWEHNPEESINTPDVSNEAEQSPWREPTPAIQRYMDDHYVLLITDERVYRTVERYR